MRKSAKLTISLPTELFDRIERHQQECGGTRSEVIASLLQAALREEQEREEVERYIRSYIEHPETEEELQESDALLNAAAWGPWE